MGSVLSRVRKAAHASRVSVSPHAGVWGRVATVVGEVRISKAQKWASLAKMVEHEALTHPCYSCQSGTCETKNRPHSSPSVNGLQGRHWLA